MLRVETYLQISFLSVSRIAVYERYYIFFFFVFQSLLLMLNCVKSVRIRGFSGPFFPAFELNTDSVRMRENKDQKNSEYVLFSRSYFHDYYYHFLDIQQDLVLGPKSSPS